MQEIDEWLKELLHDLPGESLLTAQKQIKEKLLESYRNGQKACPTCRKGDKKQWTPRSSKRDS